MVQELDSRTLDMIADEDDAVDNHKIDFPAFQQFVMSAPLHNNLMVVVHQEEVHRIHHVHIRMDQHVMMVRDDPVNLQHVPVVEVPVVKQDT